MACTVTTAGYQMVQQQQSRPKRLLLQARLQALEELQGLLAVMQHPKGA
jgi:hypothetical protein